MGGVENVFLFVCVLSDGDSELLQHSRPFLLVLLPRHPEVVLVLHDVGQHGSAQEHHVLSPGRILDPDLKFLQDKGTRRRMRRRLCPADDVSECFVFLGSAMIFLISVKLILQFQSRLHRVQWKTSRTK